MTFISDNHRQTFTWLHQMIKFRCQDVFPTLDAIKTSTPLPLAEVPNPSEELQPFTPEERLVILMALANQLYPKVWEYFMKMTTSLKLNKSDVDSFGLTKLSGTGYYQATVGTALFLLAGNHPDQQAKVWEFLLKEGALRAFGKLSWETKVNLPSVDTVLKLESDFEYQFLTGQVPQPQYSPDFPATPLTTPKTWDDLILGDHTALTIAQARKWVRHYTTVQQQYPSSGLKGYRLLMSGPSGTGKTLTAALLGQEAGKPVYRIDISNIVDKYVGETSKKLRQIFDLAEAQDWILFFDEGDALFGRRTEGGQSSNERYANQEVSYLLYKMEEYQGMIFLATNHRQAIDRAFRRRFQTLVEFRTPDEYTRQRLWAHFFEQPGGLVVDPVICQGQWRELAHRTEVSAAWIEQFYQYCLMQATARQDAHLGPAAMRQYLEWYEMERGRYYSDYEQLFTRKYCE